jgi:hypothetical protein
LGEIRSSPAGASPAPGVSQNPHYDSEGQKYAQRSVLLGALGLFFMGIILGPLAIVNAKKAENLQVPATAGKVLGWLSTVFSALIIVALIVIAVSVSTMLAPFTTAQGPLVDTEQSIPLEQPDVAQPSSPSIAPSPDPFITPVPAPSAAQLPAPSAAQSDAPADDRMSISAAGQLFLDGVCPRNRTIFAVDDLVVAAQNSGAPLDLIEAQRLAADYKIAVDEAVSLLGETRTWPDGVQQDVDALLGEYVAQLGYAEQLLGSTTEDGFIAAYYSGPDQAFSAELGGRIRAALELDQDAFASCGMQR